jgi:hypothetical protein
MARMPFRPCTEAAAFSRFTEQGRRESRPPTTVAPKEHSMLDFMMLALGLGFFVSSVAYAYACDWL